VPAGQTWAGAPAKAASTALREAAAIGKLPELFREIKHLRDQVR